MRIVFPGPDGQLISVPDPRPTPKQGKMIVLAGDGRPVGFLLTQFRT